MFVLILFECSTRKILDQIEIVLLIAFESLNFDWKTKDTFEDTFFDPFLRGGMYPSFFALRTCADQSYVQTEFSSTVLFFTLMDILVTFCQSFCFTRSPAKRSSSKLLIWPIYLVTALLLCHRIFPASLFSRICCSDNLLLFLGAFVER